MFGHIGISAAYYVHFSTKEDTSVPGKGKQDSASLRHVLIITWTINVSIMTASLLRHNSNYDGNSQGKQRLRRCVFRRLQKTDSDDADVTCCGRPFQTRAAATGKARSPTVDNRGRSAIIYVNYVVHGDAFTDHWFVWADLQSVQKWVSRDCVCVCVCDPLMYFIAPSHHMAP